MPQRVDADTFHQSHLWRFMNEVPEDENGNPRPLPGLPQSGNPDDPNAPALGFIDSQGVPLIKDYLLKHGDDGEVSGPGQQEISAYEENLLYTLYSDPQFQGLCDPTGLAAMKEAFGFEDVNGPDGPQGNRPVDAGRLELPKRVSIIDAGRLQSLEPRQLPDLFAREINHRKREFLNADGGTMEQRSAKLLGLLRDYSQALWSHGHLPSADDVMNEMLDTLEKDTRGVGMYLGKKDFCGIGMGAAQRIALGGDPNEFRFDLPDAHVSSNRTYLSMNGGMAGPMKKVDDWREAEGLERGAEKIENASPLDWLAGNQSGHNKVAGQASEANAISSTGVRWANAMFPGDDEIKDLPPTQGFEMAIDFLDAFGQFVRCDPSEGDRFTVEHTDGETPVKMEKVIERDDDGKAVSWSAKFVNAETGEDIAPQDVVGRFVDRAGRPKGDGEGAGSISLWWWGFCDRNTAQGIYKAQFGFPELDVDEVTTRNGTKFSADEAQALIDSHVGDLVTNERFWHFRFNDEPQIIQLRNGTQVQGKVGEEIFASRPGGSKVKNDMYGDLLVLHNTPERRLLGFVEVTREGNDDADKILAHRIASIAKVDDDGKVAITLKPESEGAEPRVIEGTMEQELPWDKAVERDGKKVLVQDESQPIRGFIDVQLPDRSTKRLDVKDIALIAGEQQVEHNLAVHLTMVEKLGGFFGADSAKAENVANSAKHVNKFEPFVSRNGETPEWWRGEFPEEGRTGPLVRERGDTVVFHRGLAAHAQGEEPTNQIFAGWMQINKSGRIINQGFADGYAGGEPDYGFGAEGPLEWINTRSSFNPEMNEPIRKGLLLELLVNGYSKLKEDGPETDDVAKKLNLPQNWREYRA